LWELSEDEKNQKKKKKGKKETLDDIYILGETLTNNFEVLFDRIEIKEDLTIEWKTPYGLSVTDILESHIPPPKEKYQTKWLEKI
jgi:hypothetical protein